MVLVYGGVLEETLDWTGEVDVVSVAKALQ